MLKQRIATAIVLVTVLVASLGAPSPIPALALFAVVAMLATWEWLRLTLPVHQHWLALAAAAGVAILLGWATAAFGIDDISRAASALRSCFDLLTLVAVMAWMVAVPIVVARARTTERRHVIVLSVFGVVASIALWYSLAALLLRSGAWYLVSMMALIWIADSTAYFVGRAWGRRKLAPAVSPGKTLDGALGGLAGAVLWVALNAIWPSSFGAHLIDYWGWSVALLTAALLASLSIFGDLFESVLKRRADMKDSSRLLPGHGGILDRIDALYPVAPLVLLISGGP